MSEYSYLDIYPSQSIADKIEEEDPDFQSLPGLIAEVKAYIEVMAEENIRYLEERQKESISAGETFRFLRCQERTHNNKLILQYLAAFMTYLPTEADIVDRPINPFEQLKTFTISSIGLLKEKDVAAAILSEHERLGLLNETNSWYYRGQIDRSYKSLLEAVDKARKAELEDYRQ
jgi:hypothetical protein